MKKEDLIELGNCRKPHGIKGAFVFSLHNPKESILKKGFKLWLHPLSTESGVASEGLQASIKSISFGNKVICFLNEVPNRNVSEEWVPFSISVAREAFPDVGEGEFYLSDLVGCEVFNEVGTKLGEVSALGSNGVQDILHVLGIEEDFDVLLIERFVTDIDIENKKIVINKPEYL